MAGLQWGVVLCSHKIKGVGTRRDGELGSLMQLTTSTCHIPGDVDTGDPELNKT